MEFVKGKSLELPVEQPFNLKTLVGDIAKFLITLSLTPFTGGIGCLLEDGTVGPHHAQTFHTDTPPHAYGPYRTMRELYLTHIQHVLEDIESGKEDKKEAVAMYVGHLELREIVEACEEFAKSETHFYFTHADSRPSQFLVDNNGRLTAIVDWEW
jgi:hypothetical protein